MVGSSNRSRVWKVNSLGVAAAIVLAMFVLVIPTRSTQALPGDFVGTVAFSVPCTSGIGVGIAFDGTNLWYSCYGGPTTDLHRASTAGVVSASYDIVPGGWAGLGALSYDATRNAIWAGEGFGGPAGEPIYKIQLDAGKNVIGTTIEANVADPGFCDVDLDDGLAFDANTVANPADDVIYYSNDCATTVIRAYSVAAFPAAVFSEPPFAWGGAACYNSGLAVGGQLLYEGSDGCSHVWVEDKVTKLPSYDFTTIVPGDPTFRDEDLECDTSTFAVDVMWSKEAYAPMRAHAFEIQAGSCGIGGGVGGPDIEVEKDFRFTDVDFPQCNFGTPLPLDHGHALVDVVLHPKTGIVLNTNPGQLYGVETVTGAGITQVYMTDTFGFQFDVNPPQAPGGVTVLVHNTTAGTCTVTDLTNGPGVIITVDNTLNVVTAYVNLTVARGFALTSSEELLLFKKFEPSPDFKGTLQVFPQHFLNEVSVEAQFGEESASAGTSAQIHLRAKKG